MLEGAKRRASMCQAYYRTSYIRARYIVSVSSNFLMQISCGINTCLLINQRCSADVLLGFTLLQYTIATHLLPFLSIKNSKILIHWTNIRKN